jgi:hypothetical protein
VQLGSLAQWISLEKKENILKEDSLYSGSRYKVRLESVYNGGFVKTRFLLNIYISKR